MKHYFLCAGMVLQMIVCSCGGNQSSDVISLSTGKMEESDLEQGTEKENNSSEEEISTEEISESDDITTTKYNTFVTEYDVEGFCVNLYEISKNNGLLYGVLNEKGEEIISVKYDEIEILHNEDYTQAYILTTYESEKLLFDSNGEKIQEIQWLADGIMYVPDIKVMKGMFDNSDIVCIGIGENYSFYKK